MIQGAGADKTKVQWCDTAQTPNPRATLGTYLWFCNICGEFTLFHLEKAKHNFYITFF